MRYFTPELYGGYNSADDAVADRAMHTREEAIAAYQAYLEQIRPQLPPSVQALNELYLHDATVVLVQQEAFQRIISFTNFMTHTLPLTAI